MKKLLLLLCVLFVVAGLSSCNTGGTDPVVPTDPVFVGTWTGAVGAGTATFTITKSSLTLYIDWGGGDAVTAVNSITGLDETARHFIITATSVTPTGSPPFVPSVGTFNYCLYDVTGNTLTLATGADNDPTFPTSLAGAFVLTKVP